MGSFKLLGWLTNPVLILFCLGKQSHEFPKNLGRLVINYFLPKLLVTYGILFIIKWRFSCSLKWSYRFPLSVILIMKRRMAIIFWSTSPIAFEHKSYWESFFGAILKHILLIYKCVIDILSSRIRHAYLMPNSSISHKNFTFGNLEICGKMIFFARNSSHEHWSNKGWGIQHLFSYHSLLGHL